MRQGTILSICVSLTLLFAIGFSQERKKAPLARQNDPAVAIVKQRLKGLLPQVVASIGSRYQLDETTVAQLQRSVLEAITSELEQAQVARRFTTASSTHAADGKLLELLLAHPPCRAAFARHLNPQQLRDYVDFINRWGRRGRQAVARRMTAWLDGQLLLSSEQRQQIEQLLLARSTSESLTDLLWGEPAATRPLDDIHGRPSFVSRLSRQSGKRLTEILSQPQADLWQLLVTPQQSPREWWGEKELVNGFDKDEKEDPRGALFREAQAQIKQAVAAGKITQAEAQAELEGLKRQLGGKQLRGKQERDEEAFDDREIIFKDALEEIEQAVQAGVITQRQARQKMEGLKRQLFGDEDDDKEDDDKEELDDAARKRAFEQGKAEIQQAVKAGAITQKQAQRALAGLMRELFGDDEDEEDGEGWQDEDERGLDERDRRDLYRAAEAALREAVEAGVVTRQQVSQRLAALREKLWADDRGEEQDDWDDEERRDGREFAYREIEQETRKLLADDGLTQELANAYLTSVKRQLFNKELDKDDALQRAYQISEELIEKLVDGNQLAAAAAADHLSGLKDRFWNNKDRQDQFEEMDPEERQLAFAEASQEVQELVAAGELTKQQAGRRIGALKKKFFDNVEKQRDDREIIFERAVAQIEALIEAGKLNREEAEQRLDGLKNQLWADKGNGEKEDWWGEQKSSRASGRERAKRIAAARLAAHAAQLGPLDARASRRLELAAKGVLQQQFEEQDRREDREPATDVLGPAPPTARAASSAGSDDVIRHPLYQRTIKRSLSKQAFARYQAAQAERQSFQEQAVRTLVVAVLDAHLMLEDPQRQRFERAAAELPVLPHRAALPSQVQLFAQLYKRRERASLSPGQQQRLALLYRELGVDEDFDLPEAN